MNTFTRFLKNHPAEILAGLTASLSGAVIAFTNGVMFSANGVNGKAIAVYALTLVAFFVGRIAENLSLRSKGVI